jgi:beta-galactosidase
VRFDISGPGHIVATDNGNATCLESFQSHERNAYNGLVLVIIRAEKGATGEIKLNAISDGLTSAMTTIHIKR